MTACSMDGLGCAPTKVVRAHGAIVTTMQTFGIALRTDPGDAGLSIGYTRTLTVLPDSPGAPRPGSYPFGVAPRGEAAVAVVRRTVGLDVATNRHAVGIALGFTENALLADIDERASVVRRLVLTPDDPFAVELRNCTAGPSCE